MEEQQEEPWDPNSLQYECAVCLRDFITAENEPVSIDGKPQCVRCLEEELKPVADGHEAAGLPKRGEQLLTDFPGVLDRINQDLRRRYEEIAVRSTICDASPTMRLQKLMLSYRRAWRKSLSFNVSTAATRSMVARAMHIWGNAQLSRKTRRINGERAPNVSHKSAKCARQYRRTTTACPWIARCPVGLGIT